MSKDMQDADMRNAYMRNADMSNTTCQLILRDDGRGYGVHVDHHENGSIMFRAGCRTFTLKEARAHWSDPNHEHPECARRILNAIEWYNEGRERGLLWELT